MKQVSIIEAKANLSGLIRGIESGKEDSVIISRNGRPVARLVQFSEASASKRIGVAKGKLKVPEDLDKYNSEIAALLGGSL